MANETAVAVVADDNSTLAANRELQLKILAFEQVFSSIVGLLGLLGAILVILVYNYRHKATLSEKIITALSVIDFCYNFFAMIILTSGKYIVTDRQGTAYIVLRSVNFFLFGFAVISSFLLIQLITVNRFYAICRPTEYKITFNKRRVRILLSVIFIIALLQGSTNASYAYIAAYVDPDSIITKIIDMEYIGMMDLNVSVASALMCLVYVKVLLKFAKQRKRLNAHAKMSSPSEYKDRVTKANAINEQTEIGLSAQTTTLLPVPNSSGGAAVMNGNSITESPPVTPANSKRSVASFLNKNITEKRRKPNNSDRVTFTLFVISIVFMFCVCPFVIDYNYKTFTKDLDHNMYLSLVIRMLFQLNFLSNPVIYFSTSKIFRGRTFEIIGYLSPRLEKYLRNSALFKNCVPTDEATTPKASRTAGRSYAMIEKSTL